MVIFKKIPFFILFFTFLISIETHARVVIEINIQDIGAYDQSRKDKNEEEACKVFRPTKKQIIQYFNHAKASKESGELLHEYYSPCISSGSVKFKGGASGRWTVQSSGLGIVIYDNGETATFFYKKNHWTDPYACTYGLGDDPIC